jgi:selenide,water dikinase
VYQINREQALVQTVDFFPPIVDDPYTFGAIAAANALSDIYAMGGRPIVALAIAAVPDDLPPEMTRAIMQGGADKVMEAGAVVAGGHTVVDREPKYGLCVTGLVDPANVTAKANAQVGDVLLLTKPLGTGVITTASKRGVADPAHLAAAIDSMLTLNRLAAEIAQTVAVHSVTDITGFGLLGHAAGIARNSGVGLQIDLDALPLLPGVSEYVQQGMVSGGLRRNQEFVERDNGVQYAAHVSGERQLILFDPQTSGGLLLALPSNAAAELMQRYAQADQPCWQIGTVVEGSGINVV